MYKLKNKIILYLFFFLGVVILQSCGINAGLESGLCKENEDIRCAQYPAGSAEYGAAVFHDLTKLPEVSKLYTVFEGGATEQNAEHVLLYARGGPTVAKLDTKSFEYNDLYKKLTDKNKWAVVHVTQYQILNPDYGKYVAVSIPDANNANAYSAAVLYKVAKYFKEEKKKNVYILTHSFGSFIVPKMLIEYKYEHYVEKVLVLAGRLDMNKEMYLSFLNGNGRKFTADTTSGLFRIVGDEEKMTLATVEEYKKNSPNKFPTGYTTQQFLNQQQSFSILQGAVGQYRYIDIFEHNKIPLKKVMFATGKNDEAVGYYTDKEIDFVNKSEANLRISEGGHGVDEEADFTTYVNFLTK